MFEANDVGFISLNENFDTTTPYGKAMVGILSVFAQYERETFVNVHRWNYRENQNRKMERDETTIWL